MYTLNVQNYACDITDNIKIQTTQTRTDNTMIVIYSFHRLRF